MLTVWLTGLPCSGKTTLACGLAGRLRAAGVPAEVLDGDEVRRHLSRDLGYSRADREEHVRRIGWVADLLSRNRVVALCAVIAPYAAVRDEVRARHGDRFFEVYLSAPAEACAERDVKGLYARQRAGTLHGLTGVDDPYEPPPAPELIVPTHAETVDQSLDRLWAAVASRLDALGQVCRDRRGLVADPGASP